MKGLFEDDGKSEISQIMIKCHFEERMEYFITLICSRVTSIMLRKFRKKSGMENSRIEMVFQWNKSKKEKDVYLEGNRGQVYMY